MRQHLSFPVNLNYLLIAFYALNAIYPRVIIADNNFIDSSNICKLYIHTISQSSKFTISHIIYIVYIVQRLVHTLSKQQLQIVTLILLLEGSKSYSVYYCYLKKYKFFFRKFFTMNTIGYCQYNSNEYINKIAIISLRIIFLCSQISGIYLFWLYLVCYKHNFEI